MKLIIDISEDVYTRLFDNSIQDNEIAVDDVCEMARSLRLGTPLPKGHGRLIDVSDIEWAKHREERNYIDYEVIDWDDIVNARTMVEADKVESEDEK